MRYDAKTIEEYFLVKFPIPTDTVSKDAAILFVKQYLSYIAKNKIDESVFKNEKTNEKLHILTDNHNSFLGTKKEPTTPETIEKGQKLNPYHLRCNCLKRFKTKQN